MSLCICPCCDSPFGLAAAASESLRLRFLSPESRVAGLCAAAESSVGVCVPLAVAILARLVSRELLFGHNARPFSPPALMGRSHAESTTKRRSGVVSARHSSSHPLDAQTRYEKRMRKSRKRTIDRMKRQALFRFCAAPVASVTSRSKARHIEERKSWDIMFQHRKAHFIETGMKG
jgi:hypothetical protein